MGLASLKFAGQVSRLEIPAGVDVEVSRQSEGRTSSFLQGPQSFLLNLSNDCIRPTHIMEDNLLYSMFADLNINHI